ncbi:MAG TPA: hypothetical protein VIJ01_18060 [Candidatus Angelobacter sp.]
MPGSLNLLFFVPVVVISQITLAQQTADTSEKAVAPIVRPVKSTNKGDAKAAAAKVPKLTPDQILANQTLESAESQARGLDAPMRSYSLLQIAEAFTVSDPAKARGLLQDAFSASLAVQDDPFTRENLQQDVFLALIPISISDVEERLAQAEPRPRKQGADGIIVRYIEKKQFDKAIDLVEAVASLDEFPYAAGGRLMEALPAEMNAEKQTLFASAAASFRAHEHKGAFGTMGDNSFTGLLIHFGDSIPPKLALESIDETLSQARKNDVKFSVTVGGEGGSASFNSNYEYQLFAVLPLLRKLDASGADKLLQENAALQSTVQKYPNGMDSVSPKPAATDKGAQPKRRGTSYNVSDNSSSKASTEEAVRQETQRRSNLILQEAETDPTQAIAQASALPLTIPLWTSPRALTLEGIARANMKKQPVSARQAVAELRKAVTDLPLRDQFTYISRAADIYLQMDDKDKAEDVVSDGLGVAAKLLDHDLNPDDPNKALKAWWPSTDAYRRLVEIETKISHPATAKLLQEIKDPDIRALESIMFARALLGLPMKRVTVAEKNKDGNRVRTSDGN